MNPAAAQEGALQRTGAMLQDRARCTGAKGKSRAPATSTDVFA